MSYLHPSLGIAENPFSERLGILPHVLLLTLIHYCCFYFIVLSSVCNGKSQHRLCGLLCLSVVLVESLHFGAKL